VLEDDEVFEDADELDDADLPDDDLDLDEDEAEQPAPATRARKAAAKPAKKAAAKAAPKAEGSGFDSNWLATHVNESVDGSTLTARDVRMLLRKMAKNGELAREVGTDRSRYDFPKGANDPTVKKVVLAVKRGELAAEKKAGLDSAKAAGAAKKAAATPAKKAPAKVTAEATPARRRRTAKA
jgi:hypothetical protein